MSVEKSIHYFVQHAITSINTLQLLMVIKLSYDIVDSQLAF